MLFHQINNCFLLRSKTNIFSNLVVKKSSNYKFLNKNFYLKKNYNSWNTWDQVKRPTGFQFTSRLIVPIASLAGVSALCFYGITGQTTDSLSEIVKKKIRQTYGYFASSLLLTSGFAYYIYKSGFIYRLMLANPWMTFFMMFGLTMTTSYVLRTLPYSPFPSPKHLIWAGYCGSVSLMLSPLAFIGGPLIVEAAAITGGVLGGMTLVASCMPSEVFSNWAGPLSIGLLGVFMSSIIGMFIPTSITIGAFLQSIVIFGGLVVFGGLFMLETKRISNKAEFCSIYGQQYDPLNESLSIYMSTINIFSRIATILWSRKRN